MFRCPPDDDFELSNLDMQQGYESASGIDPTIYFVLEREMQLNNMAGIHEVDLSQHKDVLTGQAYQPHRQLGGPRDQIAHGSIDLPQSSGISCGLSVTHQLTAVSSRNSVQQSSSIDSGSPTVGHTPGELLQGFASQASSATAFSTPAMKGQATGDVLSVERKSSLDVYTSEAENLNSVTVSQPTSSACLGSGLSSFGYSHSCSSSETVGGVNQPDLKDSRYLNTMNALKKAGLLDITMQTSDLMKRNCSLQKDIDMLEEIVKVTRQLMNDA